jgi:Uma2 family endonuclease
MLKMLTKPRRKQIRVGPHDNGKPMSLADFDKSVVQEGYLYELGKGRIEVVDVPNPSHWAQLQQVRNQLILYQAANPEKVDSVTGSNDSKILLESDQSERHPDISVYLTAPPDTKDIWSTWIPAIVVEIVSKTSIERDYHEKPDEYLAFGIDEYWIVDSFKQQMTVHTRWRGRWKTRIVKPSQKYSPLCLPGFTLELKRVFTAAKSASDPK